MRAFKGDLEIRLTRDDLKEAVKLLINERLNTITYDRINVPEISLHPDAKYVIRAKVGDGE